MQRELRLKNRKDFNYVYRRGKSLANRQFVVYMLPNSSIDRFRLGVSVSKKLGNAVVRNRIRRMMKEIVRHQQERVTPQIDLILIARMPVAALSYAEMEQSILHLLKKAKIIK